MFTPEILAAIVVAASVISTTAVVAMALRMPSATQLSAQQHKLEKATLDAEVAYKARLAENPFYKKGGGWNLTKQSQLLVDDIETATRLAAEAGVSLPLGPFERIQESIILPKDGNPYKERVSDSAPIIKVPKAKRRHLRAVKTRIRKAA